MANRKALKRYSTLAFSLFVIPTLLVARADAQGSHKVFNVQTYGATGNGTTDDTQSILKAIAAAGSNTGNTVFFPPGTYLYNKVLIATGVTFDGPGGILLSGNDNAYLAITGANSVVEDLSFHSNTSLGYGVFVSNASNFTISGNYFATGINSPIVVNASSGGKVSTNAVFVNANGSIGIAIGSSSNVSIQNNTVNLTAAASGITANACTTVTVSQNIVNSSSSSNTGYGFYGTSNKGVNCTGNTVSNIQYGLFSYNDADPVLTSNNVHNTSFGITALHSKKASITKNTVAATVVTAIEANFSDKELTIAQNTIGSAGSFGVIVQQGHDVAVTGNEISNCGLTSTTSAVIFVDNPGAKTISISDNQYKGNTTNLTYFIEAVQAKAVVNGNKTNTLLPTKVGP